VGIVLDTFNDERRAFEFVSNPLGVQTDAINDNVNNRYDIAWDAIWESAGRLTDFGYEVEMGIPFNQLRFQNVDGPQVWGVDAVRSSAPTRGWSATTSVSSHASAGPTAILPRRTR